MWVLQNPFLPPSVSLFILGKMYVANAGDSRSVLCRDGVPYPMSFDFTPVSERQVLI